ncbi:hypothetical protein Cgig2_028157 [Carnegiea gigantea]|uniref:Uncharacterized protein n=1 Tax=Carnegiea gigantea TaxID=171969 RepID=A0A9Q1JZR1_9CARY|nr:hypothetical protein Cgig2_028157 [Carnegiea gigantea]
MELQTKSAHIVKENQAPTETSVSTHGSTPAAEQPCLEFDSEGEHLIEGPNDPIEPHPRSVGSRQPEREAYITVDALKNLMSTMTNTIMRQVTKQVKKAVKAVNFARPLPHFDYVPTTGCEPSYRQPQFGRTTMPSPKRGATSVVKHGLDIVRNSFSVHHLVRGAGANLEAARGGLGEAIRASSGSGMRP